MAVDKSSWKPGQHVYRLYLKASGYDDDYSDSGANSMGPSSIATWSKLAELLQSEGFGGTPGKARPWVPDRFDPKRVYEATHGIAKAPK